MRGGTPPQETGGERPGRASVVQPGSIKESGDEAVTHSEKPLTTRTFAGVELSTESWVLFPICTTPAEGAAPLSEGGIPPGEPEGEPTLAIRPSPVLGGESSPPAASQKAGGPGASLEHTKECVAE